MMDSLHQEARLLFVLSFRAIDKVIRPQKPKIVIETMEVEIMAG
jgi:hypothetical protein